MPDSRNPFSRLRRVPHAPRLARGAVAAAAALAAACSDAPAGPAAARDAASADAAALAPRGPLLSTAPVVGTSTAMVTYGPGSSVTLASGRYRLSLPSGAVCDPETSGYGPGTWDLPCEPIRRAIQITMRTWTYADGQTAVRFYPDLRFVPSKTVTLTLYDRQAASDPRFTFVWCPSDGGACVNEALTDPSVATQRDPSGTYVFARIKHFSGYHVIAWGDDGEGGSAFGQ